PRCAQHLAIWGFRTLAEAHKLFGDRNQRPINRLGFSNAISTVSRTAPARRLYPPRSWRKHGGVLALAFTPLRAGDVLEGCALTRSRTKPNLWRSDRGCG